MDCKNDWARRIKRTFVVGRQKYGDAVSRELERQAHLIPPLSPATIDRLKTDFRQRDGKPGFEIAIDDAFHFPLRRRTHHLDQVPTDSGARASR
jgi:hypothetical protein